MTADKNSESADKRKTRRKRCHIKAGCAYLDNNHETVVSNISSGGAFLNTPYTVDVGQEIVMTLFLPEEQRASKVIGEVVWVEEHGMGVRFKMGFDAAITGFFDDPTLDSPDSGE